MPVFYHGARRRPDATAMVGPPGTIDVTRGGGEFGRGFYTQDSKANALTWVLNCPQSCVMEVDIDDQEFAALSIRALSHKKAWRLTQRLQANHTKDTYVAGVDAIVGPLNGSRYIDQQKFESATAQTLLNGSKTQRRIV